MSSLFQRLKDGLVKSTQKIVSQIDDSCNPEVSREDQLLLLEEALITSDLGVNAALAVVDNIRDSEFTRDPKELRHLIREAVFSILKEVQKPLVIDKRPFVIMAIGVNGVGKTTTIGKLASRYTQEGHKVFLAAADTFRAAAIEQLMAWGERTRCEIIRQEQGGDPGGGRLRCRKSRHSAKSGYCDFRYSGETPYQGKFDGRAEEDKTGC